jgi:hypothetical protein
MSHSRSTLSAALVAAVALAGAARAAEAEDARAVIDRAVKAAGGEKALAKRKAMTWTSKGTYYGMGAEIPFTANYALELPNKSRLEIENFMTRVVNGDKGWVQMMGETRELEKDQLAEAREALYLDGVATLVPLKGEGFKLSPLGDSKVGDAAAVGVKVAHAGHRDVKLFFDKKSGLLLKIESTVKAQEQGGKEVTQEAVYRDYTDVDGVKVPQKMTIKRDGERYVEAENSDVKFPARVPAKEFEKP